MINTKLYFELLLDYDQKSYHPLTKLGVVAYSKATKKYHWTFPLSNIKEVMAVLGKPIKISTDDINTVEVIALGKKKEVKQGPKQGVGFIKVKVSDKKPGYFIVTTVRERTPQNTLVSFDTVNALWGVVKKQPINKKVLTHTVAKNYCEALKIIAFNTHKGGEFNWKYFSGSRKYYLTFYAALKVLAHYGVIQHIVEASRSGVKRNKEHWELQTELI